MQINPAFDLPIAYSECIVVGVAVVVVAIIQRIPEAWPTATIGKRLPQGPSGTYRVPRTRSHLVLSTPENTTMHTACFFLSFFFCFFLSDPPTIMGRVVSIGALWLREEVGGGFPGWCPRYGSRGKGRNGQELMRLASWVKLVWLRLSETVSGWN